MSQQENIIAVLDAGSSKVRVLIAEVHEGALRYRGHGITDAAGMRKGLIADLAPAAAAMDRAAVMAESSAQAVIERCVVAVGAWARACGRSRKKMCALQSIARGPLPCPRIARFCTCCPSNSSLTSNLGSTIRWAWWAIGWK
jgi:hypothetical protein